jgi:hypothetical protein
MSGKIHIKVLEEVSRRKAEKVAQKLLDKGAKILSVTLTDQSNEESWDWVITYIVEQ